MLSILFLNDQPLDRCPRSIIAMPIPLPELILIIALEDWGIIQI